jgi:hypothetical protein
VLYRNIISRSLGGIEPLLSSNKNADPQIPLEKEKKI